MAEMPPCYGSSAGAHTVGQRTDRRSAACTARVRRGDGEARGARAPMHRGARVGLGKERVSGGVRPRSAVASGVDAEAAGARTRYAAHGAHDVMARRRPRPNVLPAPCLNSNISKILNRTLPTDEYESCRSSNPLPLSKRLYGVFLNRFCRKRLSALNVSLCP
jgi:hypothetical protein